MSLLRKKRKNPDNIYERVRFYPGWLIENEEAFLSKMSSKGWKLSGIHKETVYHFEACEPSDDVYAVEFLGRRTNSPEEIAADCNAGWDYVGTFGKKRYYRCDSSQPAISHPSSDSDAEQLRLSTTMTNLTTLLLLNVPGTLYCLLYTVLLLMTNGLSMAGLLSYHFIYFFGAILGVVSIYLLLRWIISAHRRGKRINTSGGAL